MSNQNYTCSGSVYGQSSHDITDIRDCSCSAILNNESNSCIPEIRINRSVIMSTVCSTFAAAPTEATCKPYCDVSESQCELMCADNSATHPVRQTATNRASERASKLGCNQLAVNVLSSYSDNGFNCRATWCP